MHQIQSIFLESKNDHQTQSKNKDRHACSKSKKKMQKMYT